MADEQHKKAIIENSKALRELTKSMSKSQAGGGTPSEEKQKSEGTGIKAVDNKIEDIKSAFSNNSTIKFFKDPVGQLGSGVKSVLSPITSLGDSFKDGFGKLGSFFSGKNKVSKHDKMVLKELKAINKGIKGGFTNMAQDGFSLNNENVLSEAIGQVVGREFITKTSFGRSVGFLTKIQTTMSLLPSAIVGAAGKGIGEKLQKTFADSKLFKSFEKFNPFKQKGDLDQGLPEGFAELYSQNSDRSERDQKFHNESTGLFGDIKAGFGHLINATNNMSNVIRESVGLDPIELSNATASALEASDADKDQVEREARKDDKLFQIGQNEQLLLALDNASEKFGLKNVKESIKGTSFSLIDYFKRMLAGAGTAAVGGAVGVGAGIAGFFKALGSGFMFLGANLPMFAKGAAAIALMGASFIPFAFALGLINDALEGFTFKKIGMFATLLTTAGVAIAAFTAAVAFTGGGVFLGIAALAAAGAALIPFGYAMKLAGDGLKSAATLFAELGEVGWDKVSQAAPAMKDLAVAFKDLAFGGIIEKITGGGFGGFVKDLKSFGTESSAIVALADAMDKLKIAVEPFQNMKFTTNIQDLLKTVASTGEELDGGFFGVNAKKATEGLGLFLGKITEHLNYNEGRGALMDSMSNLLDRSVAAQSAFSNNNTAALTGGMDSAGFGGAMNVPVVVNQGAQVTNSNPVTNITQDVHLNNRTMEFFLNPKGAQ